MEKEKKAEEQLATAQQDIQQHDEPKQPENQEPSQGRPTGEENPDWREVRHIMKDQRSKIEALEKELNQFKAPPKEEKDPLDSLSEDDVVTVADMKRYAAKVAAQTAQETYEKRSLQKEIELTPSKYSDYYDVVKYVEPLIKENPVLLESIEKSSNPREAAYTLAKMYMNGKNPGINNAKKIEENLSKPRVSESVSSVTGLQATGPRSLSLEDKARIWEESQRYASMR